MTDAVPVRLDAPVRFDVPEPPPFADPPATDVRAVAGALCELLGDPRMNAPGLRGWRKAARAAAVGLAAAGRRGAVPTVEVRNAAAVIDAAAAARDRQAVLDGRADELDGVLRDLAAVEHTAGARLTALARGVLAEARDLAAGALCPADLLPAPPSGRAGRGAAGGLLAAWAAAHFRPLWNDAEAAVAAALARDAGELLTPPDGAEPPFAHAERTAGLLAVCDRLPAAAARAAGRHHERPDGGGGPLGLAGVTLAPADRLVGWAERFLAALPDPDPTAADPAAAWRACWEAAARATYAAARRGELCLTIAAAGLEALGLSRGEQGETDAAGARPVGLALTDLGRTRLRLDAAHPLAAPRFLSSYSPPRGGAGDALPSVAAKTLFHYQPDAQASAARRSDRGPDA